MVNSMGIKAHKAMVIDSNITIEILIEQVEPYTCDEIIRGEF